MATIGRPKPAIPGDSAQIDGLTPAQVRPASLRRQVEVASTLRERGQMQPTIELPDIDSDPLGTSGAITETESERVQI